MFVTCEVTKTLNLVHANSEQLASTVHANSEQYRCDDGKYALCKLPSSNLAQCLNSL